MTTTKQYDFLNRLTFTGSAPAPGAGNGASPLPSFNYAYNTANQRTHTDSSYWVYQYDKLGQVISGKKYWANGTPVAGQQFNYNFDDIGNRQSTANGGEASGAGLRPASYRANGRSRRGCIWAVPRAPMRCCTAGCAHRSIRPRANPRTNE
jgi:hypothetical protein